MYHMYGIVVVLSLLTGALQFPFQLRLTARYLNRKFGTKFAPSLPMYSLLGALIGMIAGIAFVQVDMAGIALPTWLAVPLAMAALLTAELVVAIFPLGVFLILLIVEELFELK